VPGAPRFSLDCVARAATIVRSPADGPLAMTSPPHQTPRTGSPPADASENGSARDWTASVYDELRRMADAMMAGERVGHTLEPTALAHEVWLRLRASENAGVLDRGAFLGVAAQAMRRVLVDHARRRAAAKRPDPRARVTLAGLAAAGAAGEVDVLDLETALVRLAAMDPRAARVVELRAFAGCSAAEAAEALGVSEATVARDWRMAQSWLRRELARGGAGAASEPLPRGDDG
jgi:RNA polymerase sigma factor (TIGR02999 family)